MRDFVRVSPETQQVIKDSSVGLSATSSTPTTTPTASVSLSPTYSPTQTNVFVGVSSVVAGSGTSGTSTNVLATSSTLTWAFYTATDSLGNQFINMQTVNVVRKYTINSYLYAFAGGGTTVPTTSGITATSADIGSCNGIALDSYQNLYIASYSDHYIYVVGSGNSFAVSGFSYSSGKVYKFAGTGSGVISKKSGVAALSASLFNPYGIAIDNDNNIFVGERSGFYVNVINLVSGSWFVRSIFGNGAGSCSVSSISTVVDMKTDISGNLYILDRGCGVIKLANPTSITTTTGTSENGEYFGSITSIGNFNMYGIAVDPFGFVYVSIYSSNYIAYYDPTESSPRSPKTFWNSPYKGPLGMNFDSFGNLYISHYLSNVVVRLLSAATGQPTARPTVRPTSVPSTTAFPTPSPSKSPSSIPSVPPTASGSSIPTRAPTASTSCRPSSLLSSQPTSFPTTDPSSAITRSPSLQPSQRPTIFRTSNPTSKPTSAPTVFRIDVIVSSGSNYIGTHDNENFILKSSNNLTITGGGGEDEFTFLVRKDVVIEITDFDELEDVINLKYFQFITSIDDLSIQYSASMTKIHLTNGQEIRLWNAPFLYDDNFILYQSITQDTGQTTAKTSIYSSLSAIISPIIGIIGYIITAYALVKSSSEELNIYLSSEMIKATKWTNYEYVSNISLKDQEIRNYHMKFNSWIGMFKFFAFLPVSYFFYLRLETIYECKEDLFQQASLIINRHREEIVKGQMDEVKLRSHTVVWVDSLKDKLTSNQDSSLRDKIWISYFDFDNTDVRDKILFPIFKKFEDYILGRMDSDKDDLQAVVVTKSVDLTQTAKKVNVGVKVFPID